MQEIIIHLLDGAKKTFTHRPRPGGSYSLKMDFEGEWVVVTDEYGKRTAFPSDKVSYVEATPENRSW